MKRCLSFLYVILALVAVCHFDFNLFTANEMPSHCIFNCTQWINGNGILWITTLYLIHYEQIKVWVHSINHWLQDWLAIADDTEFVLSVRTTVSDNKLLKWDHFSKHDQKKRHFVVVWVFRELKSYSSSHCSQFSFWTSHWAGT